MTRAPTKLARWWGVVPVVALVALFALRSACAVEPLSVLAPDATAVNDPAHTTARTGSIYLARGGPLIIGFQSPGEAKLEVGGHVLHGSGLVAQRFVFARGPIALRFAAPPGARLMWSPPGRRGDPEYVGASSLSPDPPDRAHFADDAGTNPLDGWIALAMLVVVVATLLALARRRLAALPRATLLATLAIFAVGVGVRWFDSGAAGQTWDEDVYWAAGKNDVSNVVGLDFRPESWTWNYEHPPVTKYLDGIGAEFTDGFGTARQFSALWIALGCALLVPTGARLFRLRVGLLAGAIATLLPPLIAHGKVVGHESPAVLAWTLGILLALGVHDGLPALPDRASRRTLAIRLGWCGVVLGCALGSRFVNALLGPLLGVIVLVQAPVAWRRATLAWGALVMPVVACVTLALIWPRLWHAPFANLAASWAKLKGVHSPEPFLGTITNTPGAHYFLVYLAATAPIGVLVGCAAWIYRAFRERATPRATIILVAWFAIPLGVMASPVRQDGVRYVMPCVVVLALFAAAGFDGLASLAEAHADKLGRVARVAFPALAAIVIGYLAIVDARIHPYYLDYFGEQVGGAGAVERHRWFETAWWGEGVDRAVDYVNAHATANAVVFRNCIEPAHLAWFREDLWTPMTNDPTKAEWLVVYAPGTHDCKLPPDARRVFAVAADGATLAEVWQR